MPNPADNPTVKEQDDLNANFNFFQGSTVKDLFNAIKATNNNSDSKASSTPEGSTQKNARPSKPISDEEIAKKDIKEMNASDMARLLTFYSNQNKERNKTKEVLPSSLAPK